MTGAAPTPLTSWKMFRVAFTLSMVSFGGGVSGWAFREFVNKNHWVTETEFLSDMAAARILPGTNAANVIAILGYRLLGLKGASAGLAGILIGPFFLLLAVYYLFDLLQGPTLNAVMEGAAAGAIGPVFYVMVRAIRHGAREWYGLLVLFATAAALFLKTPLMLTVCVALCVSFLLVRLFGPKDAAE